MYAAAACVILLASMFLFEAKSPSQQMASNYIKTYDAISQSMGAQDSVQLGLQAYNKKDYTTALQYFLAAEEADPNNVDAKKYAGLCYVHQEDYDNALKAFDDLAALNLRFNAGNILKAATLLMRDEAGDKEAAKSILNTVVAEKQVGYEEAEEWLKKL